MSKTKEHSTDNSIKYGLFCYDTNNIGDEIQSIAARRFLPRIDFYINRDNIDTVNNQNGITKIIMNGWYMNPAKKDNLFHWPPTNKTLSPLLTSMHIDSLNNTTDIFSKKESLIFLKNFSPIGARDLSTYYYLQSKNIDSYFSGCLTLTILPDPNIPKGNFILAIDVTDQIYNKILKTTSKKVIRIDAAHPKHYSTNEKMRLAEYWLYLYQSASCVITTRLHSMLPCLAFGTPVIGISGRDEKRYSGLIDLTNHFTEASFLKQDILLDSPPSNPKSFQRLRNKLVKSCIKYTGYDSKQSFLQGKSVLELLTDPDLISALAKSVGESNQYELQQLEIKSLKKQINRQKTQLEQLSTHCEIITSEKNQVITELQSPGIKQSIKYLSNATIRYLKKKNKKSNS